MKKSVLTSLIAASAFLSTAVFAGSYAADAGYTAADTSAVAGNQNSFLDSLYVGVGINRTSDNNQKDTVYSSTGTNTVQTDTGTQKVGYDFLIGKHFNDMFAIEAGYNTYGTNTFNYSADSTNVASNSYYGMWSGTVLGVISSPAYSGFSAHVKLGAAYFSENEKVSFVDADTAYIKSSYSGFNPAYGFGIQYALDKFEVSLDWTRIDISNSTINNSSTNSSNADVGSVSVYAPDQLSLNLIYNI